MIGQRGLANVSFRTASLLTCVQTLKRTRGLFEADETFRLITTLVVVRFGFGEIFQYGDYDTEKLTL